MTSPTLFFFFFFNDTATTEIYTLSLHDALPIYVRSSLMAVNIHITIIELNALHTKRQNLFQELDNGDMRSEERFSRNAETDLVCRLLLEKKKNRTQLSMHVVCDLPFCSYLRKAP